jgi:hypothetical protein
MKYIPVKVKEKRRSEERKEVVSNLTSSILFKVLPPSKSISEFRHPNPPKPWKILTALRTNSGVQLFIIVLSTRCHKKTLEYRQENCYRKTKNFWQAQQSKEM